MYHVFITNCVVHNGIALNDQIYRSRYITVYSTEDYETALDAAVNIQQTLPYHCYVGVAGNDDMIVIDSFYGLNRPFIA